jgi:ArsR family transcriptional regulator
MILEENELDELLMLLSNPTRRRILAKLVQEKHYPLQLSRELRVSQQAVTKHLHVLEEHGVVESVTVASMEGPPRKLYKTTKNFTITISMDPRMFDARAQEPTKNASAPMTEALKAIDEEFRGVLHTQNYKERVRDLGELLVKTEEECEKLDEKRAAMLQMKSRMLKEASALILELYPDYSHRAVLYLLLENPNITVRDMAQALNMNEAEIIEVLKDLSADNVLPVRSEGRGHKRARTKPVVVRMKMIK